MTIEAFLGDPGQGKTYLMTKMAVRKIRLGHRVFANYPLEGATLYKQYHEIFEVKRLPGEKRSPIILIDEASLMFPAGSWQSIPYEVAANWKQHRHKGVDIYYTAQDFTEISKALRNLTQFVNHVKRFWTLILWSTRHPRTKAKYGGGFTIFDMAVAKKYDSYADDVEKQDFLKKGFDASVYTGDKQLPLGSGQQRK
ncbi:MAG TPA: zonular occludens toxin domain-containing protein [Bacilli bacterium]